MELLDPSIILIVSKLYLPGKPAPNLRDGSRTKRDSIKFKASFGIFF